MKNRSNEREGPELDRILGHPARRRILLGLHTAGPMSPADLSKSPIGKGIRVNVYSYHFKALEGWGLLKVVDRIPGDDHSVARYAITDRLTQPVIDAATLESISEVVASIPQALSQWIDGPYIEEISALIQASGRTPEGATE